MMLLTDKSVRDLLTAFSSPEPTPGGGSAAALASAVGASLLAMVAALPKTRNGAEEDREALASAAAALSGVRSS
jgi:formiminotetrahydrofolate cyclodeaminase